jgi:Uma2 family endonuclease
MMEIAMNSLKESLSSRVRPASHINESWEILRQVYGTHGVKEYWIADPEMGALEIYRLQRRTLKLVATLTDEDKITSPTLPGFSCHASRIFGE